MKKTKELNLFLACIPILTLIIMALMSALTWKAGMYIPLLSGIIVSCLIGKYLSIPWSEMEKGLTEGVSKALPAVFILMIVGAIIGSFIISGVIPTLIYYGVKVITPKFFLPATLFVTAIVATATGSSFTSIATVGLALMAAGAALGFPAPIIAGAVISGAYFGDKVSPLSDTTNVAPAMAGCNMFEHVSHMLKGALIALLASAIIYYFIGLNYAVTSSINSPSYMALINGLNNNFNINPILLLVPLITIIFAVKKVPAIPSLLAVALIACICAFVFQGSSVSAVFKALSSGYESKANIKILSDLLNRGGIASMGGTVLLLTTAAALGGILEKIGALNYLLQKVKSKITNDRGLLLASMFSGLFTAFSTGSQILAIIVPARMFSPAFKERGLHTKNLSRIVESVGTVGINLVPWSIPCMFAFTILKVEPSAFIPFIIFAYVDILINIFFAVTGISVVKEDTLEINKELDSVKA